MTGYLLCWGQTPEGGYRSMPTARLLVALQPETQNGKQTVTQCKNRFENRKTFQNEIQLKLMSFSHIPFCNFCKE